MTDLSDLAQGVRAALAGFNQHDRLLRLHTPLGPEVLLAEAATLTESIGPSDGVCGFRIELTALSVSAHLDLDELIGQGVRLDLLTTASRTERRPFHGHVTAAGLLGSDAGWARHALVIQPWLSLLAHRMDSRCFRGQNVMGIVDQVFARYEAQGQLMPAWRWALADPAAYPERSLCIQYQESDLDFVSRLLREEGLFKASLRSLEGAGDAAVPGVEMAAVASLHQPIRTLQVSLMDADGGSPSSEPIKLVAADGVEHNANVAGGPAVIPNVKPGLAKAAQTKRRD